MLLYSEIGDEEEVDDKTASIFSSAYLWAREKEASQEGWGGDQNGILTRDKVTFY